MKNLRLKNLCLKNKFKFKKSALKNKFALKDKSALKNKKQGDI